MHIARGFSDPVFEAQSAFRSILSVMARPGEIVDLGNAVEMPPDLPAAAGIVLLALADFETTVWLPNDRQVPWGRWLRFHTGAAIVTDCRSAVFAIMPAAGAAPPLSDFNPGDEKYPDRSATVIAVCERLDGGASVEVSGPGVSGVCRIAPVGLRPSFWSECTANSAIFPCGVDILLVAGSSVMGLPRTTAVRELGAR